MLVHIAHDEDHGDVRVEGLNVASEEVSVSIKRQPVNPFGEMACSHQVVDAAIAVGDAAAEFLPMVPGSLRLEQDRQTGCRTAARGV